MQLTATATNMSYPYELRMQPHATRINIRLVQVKPNENHNMSYPYELQMQPYATETNTWLVQVQPFATNCNS